jgi:hypothetical protein
MIEGINAVIDININRIKTLSKILKNHRSDKKASYQIMESLFNLLLKFLKIKIEI